MTEILNANTTALQAILDAVNNLPDAGGSSGDSRELDIYLEGNVTDLTSNATTIGKYIFYLNTVIETVNLPLVASIQRNAFDNCTALTTVVAPSLINVGDYAFAYCSNLPTISFPSLETIGSYSFQSCLGLGIIDLGKSITSIGSSAFRNCSNLKVVAIRQTASVVSSATDSFYNTPIASRTSAFVLVPSALLASYRSATYWKNFTIQPLENYTIDGTVTGEIDESKI